MPHRLQKWTQIKAIVVRRIILSMVRGSQSGHLVAVQGVEEVKILHLLSNLLSEMSG